MAEEDLKNFPKAPPETEDEWRRINRAVSFSEEMWKIVGPVVAVKRSWKAWAAFVVVLTAAQNPDVAGAFKTILGVFTGGSGK